MSTSSETAAPAEKKMICLRCSDGQTFKVEEKVAIKSQTVKNMLEDCPDSEVYPLPNVTSPIMAKVIEYCKRHVEAAEKDPVEDLEAFETEFMKMETRKLFDLMLAANFLDVKDLLDLTCKTTADMIKDKMPEEVSEIFGIENDFSPEEEEAIRSENQWAFE